MNKYVFMVLFALVFWIAETWYFGWNMQPETPYEAMADTVVIVLMFWGVVGDILRNVTWQKSTHITVAKEDLSDTIRKI